MKVAKNVYISELLNISKKRLIARVEKEKRIPALYCIVLPLGTAGIFEIYQYSQLRRSYFSEKHPVVVGLAVSKEDASIMMARMAADLEAKQCLKQPADYFEKDGL